MKIDDIVPCAELRPYISRYWIWDGESELPTMLPGTGGELVFQYEGGMKVRLEDGEFQRLPKSAMLSPRCRRFPLHTQEPVGFVSVRFRVGALRHFCRIPSGELVDRYLSAADIWGRSGAAVEARITDSRTNGERISVVESFLLEQFRSNKQSSYEWLDRAFHQLYYHRAKSLDMVVSQSDVSVRHFQKVFKQYAKVSPKYFRRVARMEIVMRQLLLDGRSRYLDLALENGFYDQAHFIKDFQSFTGETPTRFLRAPNFRTHFYNPSLRP